MVKNMDGIIADLSNDLKARVEAVVQLTEELEETKASHEAEEAKLLAKLELAKRDLKRVQIALEALSGNEIPLPAETDSHVRPPNGGELPTAAVPSPVQVPLPTPQIPVVDPRPAQTVDLRPTCNSCGTGKMNYTSRTLNNGKVVTLWLCSECRNERF